MNKENEKPIAKEDLQFNWRQWDAETLGRKMLETQKPRRTYPGLQMKLPHNAK